MQFIKGRSLRYRMESGELDTREALKVACDVAHGLEAAHRAGVIHRDLKPENVMTTTDGFNKVLDALKRLQAMWARADEDDPLNIELNQLLEFASANR